jgi:hypothetical protein
MKTVKHPIDHGGVDQILAALTRCLILFGQAAVAPEPAEGAFDDPPFLQHHEPFRFGWPLHDLQRDAGFAFAPRFQLTGVGAVGIHLLKARKPPPQVSEQFPGSLSVRQVCRMDPQIEDQTQGIDDQRAFAAFDLLGGIIAAGPPFSVVFTVWLSTTAALGLASRPSSWRTWPRKAAWIRCQAPSRRQVRKYQ